MYETQSGLMKTVIFVLVPRLAPCPVFMTWTMLALSFVLLTRLAVDQSVATTVGTLLVLKGVPSTEHVDTKITRIFNFSQV